MFSRCFVVLDFISQMLQMAHMQPMRYARRISSYIRSIFHESRAATALVAHMFVHERCSVSSSHTIRHAENMEKIQQRDIVSIGVTLMIDYDTTTMTEGNILRRYREINLCSDDRASMAALHLLVAEPMISKVTKRTSWLDFFRLLSR